jgi:hypothetical protein
MPGCPTGLSKSPFVFLRLCTKKPDPDLFARPVFPASSSHPAGQELPLPLEYQPPCLESNPDPPHQKLRTLPAPSAPAKQRSRPTASPAPLYPKLPKRRPLTQAARAGRRRAGRSALACGRTGRGAGSRTAWCRSSPAPACPPAPAAGRARGRAGWRPAAPSMPRTCGTAAAGEQR